MSFHYFLSLILICSSFALADVTSAPTTTKKKNSVEEIFIWKMSDELKLSAQEEKKFSEIHKDLNRKKAELQAELQKLSYASHDNPGLTKPQIADVVKKYKKTLMEYNSLNLQELDKMKTLLGERRFLDYLAIKQDINLKLKSLVLGEDSQKSAKPLPPPQIIEEK